MLFFVYTGFDASERERFRVGALPVPNQYSGRYMSCWKLEMFTTLKKARLMNGKM